MAIWPFKRRKRSKTAEEKRPAVDVDNGSIHSVRSARIGRSIPSRAKSFLKRKSSRRSVTKDREFAPELNSDLALEPPLEQQEDAHMMDYEYHANHLHADVGRDHTSSESSHRPHKQSSLIRRLSKRKDKKVQPPSAYETHLGRHSSRASRRYGPDNRPMTSSSSIPRTSIESNISSRTYKIKPLDLFSAYPTLHYEDDSSPTSDRYRFPGGPSLIPSRTNSRRTNSRNTENWRYKSGPLTSVENLGDHRRRVDDLVDELDAKGLREAMERDQRRRERKQREYDERQRIRHEKDTGEGQYQHHDQHHEQKNAFDSNPAFQQHHHPDYNQAESSAQAQERERNRIGYAMDGTQTPLSWFNDSNSELSVARRREDRGSEFARVETPQSLENYGRQPMTPPPEPIPEVVVDEASPQRQKQNPWTSFIKRATSARIKKEQSRGSRKSSGSGIRANHSALLTDSEGEDQGRNIEPRQSHASQQISEAPRASSDLDEAPDDLRAPFPRPNPHHLAVQDFRHRQGQTPGTHIPKEVVLAMNALATGKVHEDKDYLSTIRYSEDFDEFHDELRDEVPYQVQPYHHANGSSKSNLSAGLRSASGTYARYSPLEDRPESREAREIRDLRELREGRDSREARYSPVPIRTSGAASPDHGGARSVMSTSLASIDSEGSWLSGRINSRLSVQQISPLRTSASSLRKRFREMEDHEAMGADDDYFSGVDIEKHEDAEEGGARLDLDDSEDDIMADEEDDDEDERERERDMWREGMERKVKMKDAQRAMSREATLDELPGESPPTANIDSVHHEGHRAREIVDEPDNYDFDTPREQPMFERTETVNTTNQPFATPLEHPAHSYTRTTTQSTILPDSFETPLEYPGPNSFKRTGTVGTMDTTNEPFATPLEHSNHNHPSYFRTVGSNDFETPLEHPHPRER
jgi:hypothetical protein